MCNLTCDPAGLTLIKTFEGCVLSAYADQGGVWTIGYGHTGRSIHAGMTITLDQAEVLLESDLAAAVTAVNRLVQTGINQNQFNALVDFAFNLGPAALAQSTLLRNINAEDFSDVDSHFCAWDHCNGAVNAGLLRRRQAEATLFSQPCTATPG